MIDIEDLKRAMDDKTILVSIMFANNEIGVVQPIAEIGKLCPRKGSHPSTRMRVQAVGKIPVDVQAMNIDVLSADGAQDLRAEGSWRAVCAAGVIRACRSRRRSTAAATSAGCGRAR